MDRIYSTVIPLFMITNLNVEFHFAEKFGSGIQTQSQTFENNLFRLSKLN